MTDFVYPRTISIRRPNPLPSIGITAYAGVTEANESMVATNLPASIQQSRDTGRPLGGTPSDAPQRAQWRVFIPAGSVANGKIQTRDVVVDDLGNRYQVVDPYWNSLGYRLTVELLQA